LDTPILKLSFYVFRAREHHNLSQVAWLTDVRRPSTKGADVEAQIAGVVP